MGKKAGSGWQGLLKIAEYDDGQTVRESGYWAGQKLYAWNRYVEITTRAMVDQPAWQAGVVYVDLFCGPGICQTRERGERFPGSPLIAAHAPKPFSKILLCELDPENARACDIRMQNTPAASRYRLFQGDCNQRIEQIAAEIPDKALTLAFLDPTGLHVAMDTVVTLANRGAVDLVILFPVAMDIMRNDNTYYFKNSASKLDLVLGEGAGWRKRKESVENATPAEQRRLYTTLYQQQLKRLAGYEHFGDISIEGRNGPLYRLVYASKHERGLDFWHKSVAKEISGQGMLPFD